MLKYLTLIALLIPLVGAGCSPNDSETKKLSKNQTVEEEYQDRLHNRIDKLSDKPTEFRIGFTSWLTPSEVSDLLKKEEAPTRLLALYILAPEVRDDWRVYVEWNRQDSTAVTCSDLKSSILDMVASGKAGSSAESYQALAAVDDCNGALQVGFIEVIALPSDIGDWWDSNNGAIRYAQPFVSDVDAAQFPYEPGIPILGGS